jgi:integrase
MLSISLPPEAGGFNPEQQRLRRPAGPGKARIRLLCGLGRNMKIKFTRQNIDALEAPPTGEVFAWCSDKPGWGVRILASGRKSWVVQFRDKSGKSRRHTIGDLRVVPLSMAEQRASELLSHAKLGFDLLAEEKTARQRKAVERERSIGAMVRAYLDEPEVRRKRSFPETARYLSTHWKPVHGLSAETVTRHELAPVLRRIASERGEISANRARSALSGLFVYAITHGWLRREAVPTTHLPKWAERSRERVLSLDELAQVWTAAPEVNPTFGAIVRLLILTGCRKSEVAALRWHEVEPLERALVTLPPQRVKSNRPVTIPLAPAAVEILRGVPRWSDQLVFPSFGWSHPKKALDARVALPPWTIHDLRRSCRSLWIDGEHGLGLDVHLSELMLGHALPGIIGVYDKATRLPERRRALEAWARLVLRAAGEPADETKVVQLRG